MEFFKLEFSENAEKLDIDALSADQRSALFSGVEPNPEEHDIFRVLLAVLECDASPSWNDRQKKRKRFHLVDRALIDMRPRVKEIRIMGVYPPSIAADGSAEFDLEAQAGAKILDVANANLRFSGPIKNWWRKRRPLVAANRTDRLVQWVFSREWLDRGQQCGGEFLCVVPKDLPEVNRVVSCFADFKEKRGRAIEKTRKVVCLGVS
jgi:hypothetical protein